MFVRALVLVALVLSQPLIAQPTGDPVRVKPPRVERPDINLWADTYANMGYPSVLVLAGRSASTSKDGLTTAPDSGFAYAFKSEFEMLINDPSVDMELIDQDAIAAAIDRLNTQLDIAGEDTAVRMIGTEVDAQVAIVMKFLEFDPDFNPGSNARMTAEVVDIESGRKLFVQPFEWRDPTSMEWIRRYANDLAVKMIKDLSGRVNNPTRVTLRVMGLGDSPILISDFASAIIEHVRGVETVQARGGLRSEPDPVTGVPENMQRYTVRYRGDPITLAADIQRKTSGVIDNREVSLVQFDSAGVFLRVADPPVTEAPDPTDASTPRQTRSCCGDGASIPFCRSVILTESTQGAHCRDCLAEVYERKGSPRIAVLVNRAPTRGERDAAISRGGGSLSAENLILVQTVGVGNQGAGGGGESSGSGSVDEEEFRRITELETQARQLEAAIQDRLGPNLLGFNRVDGEIARQNIRREAARQDRVFGEGEIVQILRDQNVADVVIFGYGTSRGTGEQKEFSYTFKAVNLADAAYLAGANAAARGDNHLDALYIDALTEQAVSRIACELIRQWSPPTTLETTLKGVRDSEDFDAFQQAIKWLRAEEDFPIRVIGDPELLGGDNRGTARFALEYNCRFDELFDAFSRLGERLPFRLEVEALQTNRVVFNLSP